MTAYFQQLFQIGAYKRSQGRVTRQVTFISLVVVAAAGAWSLFATLEGAGDDAASQSAIMVAFGVFAAGCWAAYRLVQLPKFADFLISVEAEMSKVSWPSRGELWRASIVVMLTIFVLAALLFAYDFLWREIIGTILGEDTAIAGFLSRLFGGG